MKKCPHSCADCGATLMDIGEFEGICHCWNKKGSEAMKIKKARTDVGAIMQIGDLLDEFYPDVRIAILEYCLIIANKDLEG